MLNDQNSAKISNFSKLLIGLTAFLAISYFMSFTKSCSSKDTREKVKTALVNPKYKDSITGFELQDFTGSLTIKNEGSFWTVSRSNDNTSSGTYTLPASPERINNLLEKLTTVRNLYKISDKINKNSALGLTNGTEFHLRYSMNEDFHELIFGNQDFSLSSRYMMTEKSTQVYETDNTLDTFFTTSIQSWAEPFIISQVVLGKIKAQDIQRTQAVNSENHITAVSDIQKLLDLRHGGLPEAEELSLLTQEKNRLPELIITLELGNKNEIELNIFKSKSADENEFIVLTEYKREKTSTPVFTSASKISSWTYNKIKEITL